MTSLVTPPATTDVDDGPAIAELHRLHALQRQAFRADPCPSADSRKARLGALTPARPRTAARPAWARWPAW
jgi:hypothetical protein